MSLSLKRYVEGKRIEDTHLWPLSSRVTEVGILDHITILALYSMLKKEEVVLLVLRSLWSWFKDPKLEKKCQETSQHIPRTCTTKLVSTIYKQAHTIHRQLQIKCLPTFILFQNGHFGQNWKCNVLSRSWTTVLDLEKLCCIREK